MSPYPVVPFGSNKTNPTAGVIAAAAALLLTAGCAPIDDSPALASESLFTRIIRGTTLCSDTDNDGAYCGTEHWTLYVHEDGSRYLHVVGDNPRENGVRHGVVRLNSAGAVEQAFASITRDGAFIGSSLATMADEGGLAAVDDTRFEGDNATFRIEEIPTLGPATSPGPPG